MKKCLINTLHLPPAAVSYFCFWFIPDSHHRHRAASAPHRSCRLLPPHGDQQWAGSRLSGRDITFPNIYRWKFVHIWKRAPLSPPVGAIPCRHLSCSLCSLCLCVWLWMCVCVWQGEGEERESLYLTRQTDLAWASHVYRRSCVVTHLSFLNECKCTANCTVQVTVGCTKSRSFMLLE